MSLVPVYHPELFGEIRIHYYLHQDKISVYQIVPGKFGEYFIDEFDTLTKARNFVKDNFSDEKKETTTNQ